MVVREEPLPSNWLGGSCYLNHHALIGLLPLLVRCLATSWSLMLLLFPQNFQFCKILEVVGKFGNSHLPHFMCVCVIIIIII